MTYLRNNLQVMIRQNKKNVYMVFFKKAFQLLLQQDDSFLQLELLGVSFPWKPIKAFSNLKLKEPPTHDALF